MRALRLSLYFCVGLMLAAATMFSYAAVVPLRLPSTVGGGAGGYVTRPGAAFSGFAYNAGLTGTVGGRAFTAPATWRMAANGGQFALGLVRASPSRLVAGAVAAWLLEEGIEWINGQFVKKTVLAPYAVGRCTGSGLPPAYAAGLPVDNYAYESCIGTIKVKLEAAYPAEMPITFNSLSGLQLRWNHKSSSSLWNVGTFTQTGTATPDPVYEPATDADFAPLPGKITDAVATQLAPYGLPLQNPQVDTSPIHLPASDPYFDPTTNSYWRQVVVVTPSSTGETAEAETGKEPVDEAGNPITDPETGEPVTPKEETDHCKENPDSLGCLDVGEPEDNDLQEQQRDIAGIAPVGGFGADNASCPADETYTVRGGFQVAMSYGPICQMATSFRPVIIGFAWVTALLIFFGIYRRNAG